jgi:hypothetical protein
MSSIFETIKDKIISFFTAEKTKYEKEQVSNENYQQSKKKNESLMDTSSVSILDDSERMSFLKMQQNYNNYDENNIKTSLKIIDLKIVPMFYLLFAFLNISLMFIIAYNQGMTEKTFPAFFTPVSSNGIKIIDFFEIGHIHPFTYFVINSLMSLLGTIVVFSIYFKFSFEHQEANFINFIILSSGLICQTLQYIFGLSFLIPNIISIENLSLKTGQIFLLTSSFLTVIFGMFSTVNYYIIRNYKNSIYLNIKEEKEDMNQRNNFYYKIVTFTYLLLFSVIYLFFHLYKHQHIILKENYDYIEKNYLFIYSIFPYFIYIFQSFVFFFFKEDMAKMSINLKSMSNNLACDRAQKNSF